MAHGMRHGTSLEPPNRWGNTEEKEGAAWMAQKAALPMLSSSVNPNVCFTWLMLICTQQTMIVALGLNRIQ